jgi:chaperonin GroES
MNLKPLEDKIVIKVIKEEQTTSSGLIITPSSSEKPSEGIVVAIGPGITLQDGSKVIPDLEVGNKVVFSKYGGTPVDVDGEEYLILPYRDIFVVLGSE